MLAVRDLLTVAESSDKNRRHKVTSVPHRGQHSQFSKKAKRGAAPTRGCVKMEIFSHKTMPAYVLLFTGPLVLLSILKVVYNIFFHPLRKFPGPRVNKISIIPYLWSVFRG
jgi:hypothetical protein